MSELDSLYQRIMGELDAVRQRNAEERNRREEKQGAAAGEPGRNDAGEPDLEQALRAVGARAQRETAPASPQQSQLRPANPKFDGARPIDARQADAQVTPTDSAPAGIAPSQSVQSRPVPSGERRIVPPDAALHNTPMAGLRGQAGEVAPPLVRPSPVGVAQPLQRLQEAVDRYLVRLSDAIRHGVLTPLVALYQRGAKPLLQAAFDRRAAAPPLEDTFRRHILAIVTTAVLLVVGLGGWAATTEFSGAVIAQGQIVVDSNVKKVQHPSGGIVGEVKVRDGVRVKAGDVLVRLDDTQTRANYAIIIKALDEMTARQAREEAERDGSEAIDFPNELLGRLDNPDVAKAVNGERRQFETRRQTREGLKGQLKERVAQSKEEIAGYSAQIVSKENQINWVKKELAGVNDLWAKNLVPYTRVTALEREKERLEGERGQLVATIAQARGKITETELQILQIDQDMRSEVGKDLADIRAKVAELVEKKVAAEDQLRRVEMRAPIDGMVHQLTVHTVGGVIGQGEVIMLIVPESDALDVEAKISPIDIDQLRIGQPALLRLTAFNQRTTPELNGKVSRISADVSEDQKTGAKYYTLRITVPESEIARLTGLQLVPGMPVEAFVQTSPRTVMTYLTKPFHDQLSRTFREK